uniref:Mis12-Mtw1 family protein n=1 Tax=Coccidioides posadasii RMSCC 3488 TaxID=454284 RepID=A0A0J6FC68_COCPO|nr:hypothetical protein CPAG_02858 [Coccidioides posadasii RMSCC 3488]
MTTILVPTRASTTNRATLHPYLDNALHDTFISDWSYSSGTKILTHSLTVGGNAITNSHVLQTPTRLSAVEWLTSMSHARAQAKDANIHGRTKNGAKIAGKENATLNGWSDATTKRKAADYEEDIEGFQFSRTSRPKKPRPSPENAAVDTAPQNLPAQKRRGRKGSPGVVDSNLETPNGYSVAEPTRRRPKRLAADEHEALPRSKKQLQDSETTVGRSTTKKGRPGKTKDPDLPHGVIEENEERETTPQPQVAETKIALPFADTPVIQRNKEMRQERGRGKRRSSFGMRGRRASSLIDSGASNALPHDKVDVAEFYKHIESEDLSEPRRMRQLLTWCATRAMGDKPSGSRSDDESAKLAARVIQEEMLKEFSNRSELSDWFSREETASPAVVVKKPNPKNVQNAEKIKELEQHIQRLQAERQSLADLLRAPSLPSIEPPSEETDFNQKSESQPRLSSPDLIDPALLDVSQRSLLDVVKEPLFPSQPQSQSLPTTSRMVSETSDPISSLTIRLSSLSSSLAPTLDSFAAGIHDLELYRSAADNVAGGVLRACARRLEERDLRGSTRSPVTAEVKSESEGDDGGGMTKKDIEKEDLRVVLGALSRLERR